MIAHVFGKAVEKFGSSIIVDVGGIGYEVQVATGDYEKISINQDVKLYTHHHIREQSQELFGFSSLMAKKLFELLITVQGIGPKAALAILSLGESEVVRNAIALQDDSFISKASGVGKKIANRVVIDLSDKVGVSSKGAILHAEDIGTSANQDEALEALIALGYTLSDATNALIKVPSDLDVSERVKLALKGGV